MKYLLFIAGLVFVSTADAKVTRSTDSCANGSCAVQATVAVQPAPVIVQPPPVVVAPPPVLYGCGGGVATSAGGCLGSRGSGCVGGQGEPGRRKLLSGGLLHGGRVARRDRGSSGYSASVSVTTWDNRPAPAPAPAVVPQPLPPQRLDEPK